MTNVLGKNMFYDSYVSIRELKAWMHQIYFKHPRFIELWRKERKETENRRK